MSSANANGWLVRYLVTREGFFGTKYLLYTTDAAEASRLFMKNKKNELHTIQETLIHDVNVTSVQYQDKRVNDLPRVG